MTVHSPMNVRRNGSAYECVVVDIDTQNDFCDIGGAMPVVNTGDLLPSIRRVLAWVEQYHVPMVSSMEFHRSTEVSDNGHRPLCCIDGTIGQQKVPGTLLTRSTFVEVDNTLCCPLDLFKQFQQVVFPKRSPDLLANPKADRFFTGLRVNEYILFGIGLEEAIKLLTLGLLVRDKRVTVVVDACGFWHRATADFALRQISAKGARLTTVEELLRRSVRSGNGKRFGRPCRIAPANAEGSNGRSELP